jgi:hypothetical protein
MAAKNRMSDSDIRFDSKLNARLEALSPGLSKSLVRLCGIRPGIAHRALGLLLEYACKAQNTGMILSARKAIAEIPSSWLELNLSQVAEEYLDIQDEWEFRRLLELLRFSCPNLLRHFLEVGRASSNPEVREAADDFSEI